MTTPIYPAPRSSPLDPPPEYGRWRQERPVRRARLWDGSEPWAVSGFDEVRAVLKDHQRFSSVPAHSGYPILSPSVVAGKKSSLLPHLDPPEHDRHRRAVMSEFTARRVVTLRPGIEAMVDRLLQRMGEAGPPADLVRALAAPVPADLTCELLGLPAEDGAFFETRLRARMSYDGDPGLAERAEQDIRDYFRAVVDDRTRSPRDDLSSRLVVGSVLTGQLTRDAAARLLHVLLIGGFETTQNMISLGTITLLQEPAQLEGLRREPGLWPSAIEELLRYLSVVHVEVRAAMEDVELAGELIRKGEGVILLLGAANRDGRVFPDPDRFDIRRDDRHHVAFGFGVHTCLGQVVARVVLEVVFSRLFSAFPTLRLAAPVDRLPFKEEMVIYGVRELPVTWDPGTGGD